MGKRAKGKLRKISKKKILSLFLSVFLILTMTFPQTVYAYTPNLSIVSDTYVVVDMETGQVLIEKNKDKRKAPASITKIMTLALALQRGNLDDKITVSREAAYSIEPNSTHIALEPGEIVTFRDVVMATQLISANDAANVVAEYTSGAMTTFVDLMNSKVHDLGLKNTHFANPNGLDKKGHYSSAADMAEITRFALSVPGFAEVFGATEYKMPRTNIKDRGYKFLVQNAMMNKNSKYYYEGILGGKLGYTWDANHTLVALAEKNDMKLIVVTMDSKGTAAKFNDAAKLLDYCFDNYQKITLSPHDIGVKEVPVSDVNTPSAKIRLSTNTVHSFLAPIGTANNYKIVYNVPEYYVNSRDINPTFSVTTPDGVVMYTAPLTFSIEEIVKPSGTEVIPTARLGTGDAVADSMVIAFFMLLLIVFVGFFVYLSYRVFIMMGYGIKKQTRKNKRMLLEKRQKNARERNRGQVSFIRKERERIYDEIDRVDINHLKSSYKKSIQKNAPKYYSSKRNV